MFQRILVPLDGSSCAEQALPLAIRLARASGGALSLLQVVPPLADHHQQDQHDRAQQTAFSNADAYLSHILAREDLEGIGIVKEVRSGNPAQQILLVAKEQEIDLIVICSHGRTGFRRMLAGSVAQKVAYHSPIAVLVLHANHPLASEAHGAQGYATQVFVPLDGSPLAEAALLPAAQLSAALSAPGNGTLHLARVVVRTIPMKDIAGVMQIMTREEVAEAGIYLHKVEQRLQESEFAPLQISTVSSAVAGADVVNPLLWLAEEGNYSTGHGIIRGSDLIAIATHGRSGLAHLAMGSITERILSSTILPVLIVHGEKNEYSTLHESAFAGIDKPHLYNDVSGNGVAHV
ncbi:MAG TPA: universal stress protein [Ktedonobacteraceae bacterium]|jgi:nucleotide-binding universal stress UspA family protein|nr:universal stress protein [Ktedonobacteraceae bacterium]